MTKTRSAFFICLLATGFLLNTRQVQAEERILWQDTFDDGTLAHWKTQRNQQWINPTKPCEWFAQATEWVNEDKRAGIRIFSNPCITELVAQNLDLGTQSSYTVSFDWILAESAEMDRGFVFAWHDPKNFYTLKQFGTQLQIIKVLQGQELPLTNAITSFPFQANQTYHVSIQVQLQHTLGVKINGQQLLNVSDSGEYFQNATTPLTIALQASAGEISKSIEWFDNVLVENPAATPATLVDLAVQSWKQSDSAWENLEYDSAQKWSDNPRIQRWGCALTSIASVLNFHGISKLPDGKDVNPGTLNSWLQTQADGYIGQGAVNWLAITRLSKQMASILNTPKLEYSRHLPDLEFAKQLIQDKQPPILEIPGHFFIGKGITADGQDILIQDPAYTYQKLSQHHDAVISVRQLKPSHTDLSYLLAVAPAGTQLEIRDAQNVKVNTIAATDTIRDPLTGKSTESWQQIEVPQPKEGTYQLLIKTASPSEYQVKLYSYDQQANLTQNTLTGNTDNSGDTYSIQFRKAAPALVKEKVSWESLQRDMEYWNSRKAFSLPIVGKELLNMLRSGRKLPLKTQRAFVKTLHLCVTATQWWMKPTVYGQLTHKLELLEQQYK